MVGCLLTADHLLPPASVSISAQVVSVAKVPVAEQPSCSFGSLGGDATRIALKDAEGTSWELLLPEELVPVERFPAESKLDVAYQTSAFNFLAREHLLTLSEQGKVALFMIHGSRPAPVPAIDLDWAFGGVCSVPSYCSVVQSQMRAELGGEQVTDPCRSKLGDFSISSSSSFAMGNAPAGCSSSICDIPSQFSAFGVRSP